MSRPDTAYETAVMILGYGGFPICITGIFEGKSTVQVLEVQTNTEGKATLLSNNSHERVLFTVVLVHHAWQVAKRSGLVPLTHKL